jgi:hypothetical protein
MHKVQALSSSLRLKFVATGPDILKLSKIIQLCALILHFDVVLSALKFQKCVLWPFLNEHGTLSDQEQRGQQALFEEYLLFVIWGFGRQKIMAPSSQLSPTRLLIGHEPFLVRVDVHLGDVPSPIGPSCTKQINASLGELAIRLFVCPANLGFARFGRLRNAGPNVANIHGTPKTTKSLAHASVSARFGPTSALVLCRLASGRQLEFPFLCVINCAVSP